jgi:hypothetical protein
VGDEPGTGYEARYDVGLRFTDLAEPDVQWLTAVLDSER